MRGSSKSLPKYATHRASGQAVVRLCGTDFYLGPHGTKASKVEYDRLVGEWLANGRRLTVVVTEQHLTVVELCAEYWRFCKTYYIKNGKATDEQAGVKAATSRCARWSMNYANRNLLAVGWCTQRGGWAIG